MKHFLPFPQRVPFPAHWLGYSHMMLPKPITAGESGTTLNSLDQLGLTPESSGEEDVGPPTQGSTSQDKGDIAGRLSQL